VSGIAIWQVDIEFLEIRIYLCEAIDEWFNDFNALVLPDAHSHSWRGRTATTTLESETCRWSSEDVGIV